MLKAHIKWWTARPDCLTVSFLGVLAHILILAGLVTLAMSVALAPSGLGWQKSVLTSAIVGWQSVAGVVTALFFLKSTHVTSAVLIAVGTPIGLLLSTLCFVLLPEELGRGWSWALPSVLSLPLVLWVRRTPFKRPSLKSTLLAGAAGFPAYLTVLAFWQRWPMVGDPWWGLDGNLSVNASIAASISTAGPDQSLATLGNGIPYYWLADGWAGTVARVLDISELWVLTRCLFALTIVIATVALWALSGLLTRQLGVRFFGTLIAGICSFLIVSASNAGSLLFVPFSPTVQFGLLGLIALTIVVGIFMAARPTFGALAILALLSIEVALARTFFSVLAVAGALMVLAVAMKIDHQRIQALLLAAAVGVGTLIGGLVVLAPETQGESEVGVHLQINADLASLLGLVPFNGILGEILGTTVAMIVVFAGCVGLLNVVHARSWFRNPLVCWSFGLLACISLGLVAMWQTGFSQISLLNGLVPVVCVAGVLTGVTVRYGLGSAGWNHLRSLRGSSLWIAPTTLAMLSVLVWPQLTGFTFDGVARWLFPILIVIICGSVAVFSVPRVNRPNNRGVAARFALTLTLTTLMGAIASQLIALTLEQPQVDPMRQYALTDSHLSTGVWVQENVPRSAIFATNRQCWLPLEVPPRCQSGVFTVSSLGLRQVLIEGSTYGITTDLENAGSELAWARDRVVQSYEFGLRPSVETHTYLWQEGVRYVWIDQQVPNAGQWAPFADVIHRGDWVTILQLNRPEDQIH